MRRYTFKHFPKGAKVEIKAHYFGGKCVPAQVQDSWESLHLCKLDGFSSAYDEWIAPDNIRIHDTTSGVIASASFAGDWDGRWENNLKQSGQDSPECNGVADDTTRG